jgi:hypothetical protein
MARELQTVVESIGKVARKREEIRNLRDDIRQEERDIIKALIAYGMPELLKPNTRALCHFAEVERSNLS